MEKGSRSSSTVPREKAEEDNMKSIIHPILTVNLVITDINHNLGVTFLSLQIVRTTGRRFD